MKLKSLHLWIGIFSAALVLSIALVDVGRTSPGPLSAVHEREDGISTRTGCSNCHGGWGVSMTEACLECHETIANQIEIGDALHGALGDKAQRCAICHSEHHGSDFPLVNRQSFFEAGTPEPNAFRHEIVGFPMDGKHLELDCKKCHKNAHVAILPKGQFRFIGLDWDCATCHDDSHEGRYAVACASCHGQQAFDQLDAFGHEEFLPLIGGHGDLECTTCHVEGSLRSLDSLGQMAERPAPRDCLACHDSPHQDVFVEGVAQLVSMTEGGSCVTCHEEEHESFREEDLEMTDEQHAVTGFMLEVPHDEASCDDCHDSRRDHFDIRYPGRAPEECSVCHEDVHDGQFDKGTFAGQECTACHEPHQFEPHTFDLEKHELTAMPLTDSHLEVDCEECHLKPAEWEARIFRGTHSNCDGCHEDAHRGFFDEAVLDFEEVEYGDCAHCHDPTNFRDVDLEWFDHSDWTRFAVLGAHAQSDCESCHPRSEHPDETGRTFGWVDEHFGRFVGCITCHADPHEGEFNQRGLPRRVEGRKGCERCHVQASFRSFPEGFDHRLWTRFPLLGAHGEIGCADCHPPLAEVNELGRTWGRAAGNQCADCHSDPHAGQFLVGEKTDCQRCHRRTTEFADLSFNHETDGRFALGEAHSALDCSACHPTVLVDEVEIVRYRPLGFECIDCHGDQDQPRFRSRKRD